MADFLTRTVINPDDIKDLLVDLDAALKARLELDGFVENRFKPKIFLGEDTALLDNEKQKPYERPFITFLLTKRTPASLTDTKFFTGKLQHGSMNQIIVDRNTGEKICQYRRDNEITLTIRTKTKNEMYLLLQELEKIFWFSNTKRFFRNVDAMIFVSSSEKREVDDDLYVAEFVFNARTSILVREEDNTRLENIYIKYQDRTCKYFDLATQKCIFSEINGFEAEKEQAASDLDCNKSSWCKHYSERESIFANSSINIIKK